MALISTKMMPCLVQHINIFDIGGYLIVATINGTAFLIILTSNDWLGVFVTLPVVILILIIVFYIYRKKFYVARKKALPKVNIDDLPRIKKAEVFLEGD